MGIDKDTIYGLTQRINDCLHSDFGIKNLNHRMIFTACALIAKRFGTSIQQGIDYPTFYKAVMDCMQAHGLGLFVELFSGIVMNLDADTEDPKERERVKQLLGDFLDWVTQISDCVDSDDWNGEDVMGIFFNEFNRYKKKSDSGQVFTPEHIANFMYYLIDCTKDDNILDGTCGSGTLLVKAMGNMIREAGGADTDKAKAIKQSQLFGIEYDRDVFALACANMLLHKDGKANLTQMDARTEQAGDWIQSKPVTRVLMNPPYENKYGCLAIVKNVLDHVRAGVPCAFILPDKKLEKGSKKLIADMLARHCVTKIIKLPKDLFFGVGVETSIFVFEAGTPQNGREIFTYYIEDDGLVVVKNKGRHDIKNLWPAIEKQVLEDIKNFRNGAWIKPEEHLSYQVPEKPFEIYKEDFERTALKYLMYKNGVNAKDFFETSRALTDSVLYGSEITETEKSICIEIPKQQ